MFESDLVLNEVHIQLVFETVNWRLASQNNRKALYRLCSELLNPLKCNERAGLKSKDF